MKQSFDAAAYGGPGWSPRTCAHAQEIGAIWAGCGIDSEWRPLKKVLVHCPGPELNVPENRVNDLQLAALPDLEAARAEHERMQQIFKDNGIRVEHLDPGPELRPNQLFCADLFAMTPQGAVLARPASTVRAGEERQVLKTLGALGIPVIKTLTGTATFEGADLMWLDRETAVIGRGLRTNQAAVEQISALLAETGATCLCVDLPYGTMHLMGMFRMADRDLAFVWPCRTPYQLTALLRDRGIRVVPLPSEDEAQKGMAFNFVTLAPGKIMIPDGNSESIAFYASMGIECVSVKVSELIKAFGAIGCMTGILEREMESG